MTLDLNSVQLFTRVAALGAIGQAGAEFGLSPTSSTQHLQRLEAELGVKLLNRTTRAVSLTSDGEVFLAYAVKILEYIEDARLDLSGGDTRITGELRVTASATFGQRYIAPHIPEFLAHHPDAVVRLDLTDTIINIVEQGYDLAIRIGTYPASTLIAHKLADNPRGLVASPAYLDRFGVPKTPSDLVRHTCILLGAERSWRLRALDGSIEEVRVGGRFSSNLGGAITQAVLSDVGIALKSRWDISNYIKAGRLVPVLQDYRAEPAWSIWSIRPAGSFVSARVNIFTRFLEEKFKDIPY